MTVRGPYKRYKDPFTTEGRELIEVAKALVLQAQNEEDRAIKAQELKRVLEYVKANFRVDKEVHSRAQLLLRSVEGRKSL